jgi:hypothetical protein
VRAQLDSSTFEMSTKLSSVVRTELARVCPSPQVPNLNNILIANFPARPMTTMARRSRFVVIFCLF